MAVKSQGSDPKAGECSTKDDFGCFEYDDEVCRPLTRKRDRLRGPTDPSALGDGVGDGAGCEFFVVGKGEVWEESMERGNVDWRVKLGRDCLRSVLSSWPEGV